MKNLSEILNSDDDPDLSQENLLKCTEYLKENLDKNTIFTGRDYFKWEGFYLWGHGSDEEYEALKIKQLSYNDEVKIIRFTEDLMENIDPIVRVRRLKDKKLFYVGLSYLEVVDEKNMVSNLIEEMCEWIVN